MKKSLKQSFSTNEWDSELDSELDSLWADAKNHADTLAKTHLKQLSKKASAWSLVQEQGFLFDFSRSKLDESMLQKLFALLEASGFTSQRRAMFDGEKINFTENRAVLHTALRSISKNALIVDGENVREKIHKVQEAMLAYANDFHSGKIVSHTKKAFTHIVNIGIGGSYLGTKMAYQALSGANARTGKNPTSANNKKILFLSNLDSHCANDILAQIPIETTLFVVASKSFTTEETLQNAHTMKKAVVKCLGETAVSKHFVALSSNLQEVEKFGILREKTFPFWDFVGGRFSLWSSIGLPIALALGSHTYQQLLEGAREMDHHFLNAPYRQNLPILLSVVHVFWNTLLNHRSRVVVPYCEKLSAWPLFLQQLEMESNGKAIRKNGAATFGSSNHVWGETGTNAQHSFFQLLHQGDLAAPVDFIAYRQPANESLQEHHDKLTAHLLAQIEALSIGQTKAETAATMEKEKLTSDEINQLLSHRFFPGDRPSLLLMQQELDAKSLGKLIALYEHKVFCEGVFWQINSFDQWGVELGKKVAKKMLRAIKEKKPETLNACSARLARLYLENK